MHALLHEQRGPADVQLDQERNQPGDRWACTELNHGTVEYVVPTEYMVRPPQPVFYCFFIDMSHAAVSSGMLTTVCRMFLESLGHIPNGDNRMKVAIIVFGIALYISSMRFGLVDLMMVVVPDIRDVFVRENSADC